MKLLFSSGGIIPREVYVTTGTTTLSSKGGDIEFKKRGGSTRNAPRSERTIYHVVSERIRVDLARRIQNHAN